MSLLHFTDGKCSPYPYQPKDSLFSSFQDTAYDGILYHSKCAIFMLSPFLTIAYHIASLAHYSKVQPPSFDLWYFIFSLLECI
jgi:hypothetical protein